MTDSISPSPAKNVDTIVVLSVDSLRFDRVHAERNGVSLTPNLDAFSKEAIEFSEGISPGPATADSMAAILTGSYPSQFPGFSLPSPGTKPLTLAEQLSREGFATAAFHQNNLISRRYNFDRGFDTYYDISEESREESGRGKLRLRLRNLIEDTPLMKAARMTQTFLMENFGKSLYVLDEQGDSLTDRALNWLADKDQKRFLWLHYMDTHHPYLSTPEIQQKLGRELAEEQILSLSRKARSGAELSEEEVSDLEYAYDCSVRFVDEQIGRVLDSLESEGELSEAMVIVTADHGEEFLDHGNFGHRDALWDELIRVPLIMRYPNTEDTHVEGQTPVRALVETIVHGTGLFEMRNDGCEYVVAETRQGRDGIRCARGNGFKLITEEGNKTVTQVGTGEEEVISESEVPEEIFSELQARLDAVHEQHTDATSVDEEELRDDLAALGYLDK